LALLVVACGSSATGVAPSPQDPLGCGLPVPCSTTELRQGSQELSPQDASACQYQTLIANKPAHVALHFRDTTDITWDVYMNGTDPAVVVETECEINGPCTQKSVKRSVIQVPQYLDCSHGTGPPRVCGSPVEWCSTSRDVTPVCP
jgi:hypothetical protein